MPLSPIQKNPSYDYKKDLIFPRVLKFLSVKLLNSTKDEIQYVNQIKNEKENVISYTYEIVYSQNTYVRAVYFESGPSKGEIFLEDYVKNGNNQV